MKRIAYSKDALKTLGRMPTNVAKLIRSKVEQYAGEPVSLANNVKALQGRPERLRLRVGDWRVLFSDDGAVISIIRVAPRGDAYD